MMDEARAAAEQLVRLHSLGFTVFGWDALVDRIATALRVAQVQGLEEAAGVCRTQALARWAMCGDEKYRELVSTEISGRAAEAELLATMLDALAAQARAGEK